MLLKDIMRKNVKTCRVWDRLNTVAQVLWENTCGCAPVLDEHSTVVGMITDRDICMAAYTQGKALPDIPVTTAMSRVVHFARPEDTLTMAEGLMKANKVHRLPILEANGRLAGIISVDDIAKEAVRQKEAMTRDINEAEAGRTLAGICERGPAKEVNARTPVSAHSA